MVQKKYTIVISIDGRINADFLYANGVSQNIILLYELFELLGHKSFLFTRKPVKNQKLDLGMGKQFDCRSLEELKADNCPIDLFFEAGAVTTSGERRILHNLGAKVVSVHYGNSLIIDMENIIYRNNKDAGFQHISEGVDHIWVSPHHAYHQSYLEIVYSAKASVVPFIWNSKFIKDKHFRKKDFRKVSNIYIMEPNISVVKNALIPITIIEALYRTDPTAFNQAFIASGMEIKDKAYMLNNIVRNMPSLNANIAKNKVSFSPRCKFDDAFVHPDILLSHHWNNGLNYLSLEALHHNIPLVHNSEFFQEVGYFYPDFDVHKGVKALKDALENHQDNFAQHQQQNQVFLEQFSIHNKDIQKQYQQLLAQAIGDNTKVTGSTI